MLRKGIGDPDESAAELDRHGIATKHWVHWNLGAPELYEAAMRSGEGLISAGGPLVVRTGECTGRSPQDKYVVDEPGSSDAIWWEGGVRRLSEEQYEGLKAKIARYMTGRDLFVQDCYAGALPEYRVPIRIITTHAWQSLFARNMFIRYKEEPDEHVPQFTVIAAPDVEADPERDGTRSHIFVAMNFARREVLIGGTHYGGEIKKSILTIMTYLMPERGVLPMHASANYGDGFEDVAIFFGLSGTGKTALTADPKRVLIGDDEHGWCDEGIFNFEGGCYAKVIRLSPEGEPEIYETTRRFGTILENVDMDAKTRQLDLDSARIAENTRASYPISFIPNAALSGAGGQPNAVIMLTCDAFGVFPPISRLTREQAMYHFISGYTAKVAGTERGVDEPQAVFSACFGAPFMARPPGVYAKLLGERLEKHDVPVWLINTGWTGGPHGVGRRMPLDMTRALVSAALSGELEKVETRKLTRFDLSVPTTCPGVDHSLLNPKHTWSDPISYELKELELARMFVNNFERYENDVSEDVRASGPKVW